MAYARVAAQHRPLEPSGGVSEKDPQRNELHFQLHPQGSGLASLRRAWTLRVLSEA